MQEIGRADFDHPAVNALMARVRADVMDGRGLSVIAGLDPARYAPADYERLYWGMGTHLGRGVVQSFFGDWVARVEKNPNLPFRGTTTDIELRAHTDFHEVMSLASISLPEHGGVSGFVSSLAVHNEVWKARPDLLRPLYEGWYNVSVGQKTADPYKTPIYSLVDGKVSCFYNRVFFQRPEDGGAPLPADLLEAMALMDSIAARPDIRADFTLEPGEVAFWHNFTIMHSRTAFEDSPARHRLLLRLWLNVPDGRPMAEAIRQRAVLIDRDHLEGQRPAPVPA
ncbi:MAG: TauD/TfdA family dioxygenase [Caulobacteraceae bacterium]